VIQHADGAHTFAGGVPPLPGACILVVDDEPANVRLLRRLLEREGYTRVHGTSDSGEALALLDTLDPDLVVLDLHMPFPDGYALLEHIGNRTPQGGYLPVLVLTGDAGTEAKNRALALGARDFLTRPFERLEARYRIRNLLHTRRLHRELEAERASLADRVLARTRELEAAHAETLARLIRAAALRDDATGHHTRRVGDLAAEIARELGLPEARVEVIRAAAPLHDVGKIAVPDRILLKPGTLTAEERATMCRHTELGAEILAGGTCETLALAERIALAHHERWDGGGYPRGLSGEVIPLAARIVSVADFYDAVTHERPYRTSAWTPAEARAAVELERGRQFDPAVVDAFLRICCGEGSAGVEVS
jgi:putative two-component system response regulator